MSRDLNCRSRELICWLTADWVMLLICAVLVKLSVSAKSQNTFNVSICMRAQTIDGVQCGGKRSQHSPMALPQRPQYEQNRICVFTLRSTRQGLRERGVRGFAR